MGSRTEHGQPASAAALRPATVVEQFFGETMPYLRYGLYLSVSEFIGFQEDFCGA
jgi:hypothetical protein